MSESCKSLYVRTYVCIYVHVVFQKNALEQKMSLWVSVSNSSQMFPSDSVNYVYTDTTLLVVHVLGDSACILTQLPCWADISNGILQTLIVITNLDFHLLSSSFSFACLLPSSPSPYHWPSQSARDGHAHMEQHTHTYNTWSVNTVNRTVHTNWLLIHYSVHILSICWHQEHISLCHISTRPTLTLLFLDTFFLVSGKVSVFENKENVIPTLGVRIQMACCKHMLTSLFISLFLTYCLVLPILYTTSTFKPALHVCTYIMAHIYNTKCLH